MQSNFPKDFLWGAATASFQVEGHLLADDAGPTSWLNFCREPGRIANDDIPLVGASQYTLYKDDVKLMKNLGLKAYRFSIGWSRIFPEGRGTFNPKGLDYYNRLIDELLANNIQPWVTMFHWDLPQKLEDNGGWQNKDTCKAFADYAAFMTANISDRVKNYFTVNEISCFTVAAYGNGGFAPGLNLPAKGVNQTIHNGCLAHGMCVQAIRGAAKGKVNIGLVDNCAATVPVIETPENIAAAKQAFRIINGRISTVIHEGKYIDEYIQSCGADMPEYTDEELKIINSPTDFDAFNLYSPTYIMADPESPHGYREVVKAENHPTMNMPWLFVGPEILYWVGRFNHELWGTKALYITENGCAAKDKKSLDGEVYDTDRLMYLRQHLLSVKRAIDDNIPYQGYFVWSLLDNFEWACGFQKRFGIVYVDYNTLQRTPKLSAKFYKEVIKANKVL